MSAKVDERFLDYSIHHLDLYYGTLYHRVKGHENSRLELLS